MVAPSDDRRDHYKEVEGVPYQLEKNHKYLVRCPDEGGSKEVITTGDNMRLASEKSHRSARDRP